MITFYVTVALVVVAVLCRGVLARAVVGGAATLAASAIYLTSVGHPRPTWAEVACKAEEGTVLHSMLVEDVEIRVWIQPDGCEDAFYVLPWSKSVAEQLAKAEEEAKAKEGAGVRLKFPFENSWDDRDPMPYAMPQPKMPEKAAEPPPPEVREIPV